MSRKAMAQRASSLSLVIDMTEDDSEWESAPLHVFVKPEPGSSRSLSPESPRVQSGKGIMAEQDAEYEIAQAEDVANAIRRGKQGKLPKAENDEEKQLRWAESIKLKDKAPQQLLRDAKQQEAVPARSDQKVVEVGTRTGASAQGERRAERAARMAESFARIVGKIRPKRTESLANLPKRTESLASLPKRTESLANLPKRKSGQGSGGGAVSAEAGSNGGVQGDGAVSAEAASTRLQGSEGVANAEAASGGVQGDGAVSAEAADTGLQFPSRNGIPSATKWHPSHGL
eukprot:g8760.t1